MTKNLILSCLAGALVVSVCPVCQAQPSSTPFARWVTLGGMALPPHLPFNIGVSYSFGDERLYQIGFNAIGDDPFSHYTRAVHFGYGHRVIRGPVWVAGFLGPAGMDGKKDIDDERGFARREHFVTAGAVANLQIFFIPLPEIGMGIEMLGNLNPKYSTLTARLSLQLNNGR